MQLPRSTLRFVRAKLGYLRQTLALGRAQARAMRNAAGLPIPVYLAADGTPCAWPQRGIIPHRVLVCSIPKAGTYLVSELLNRLGSIPTRLHISTDGQSIVDSRFATREEARNEFGRLWHSISIDRVLPLIQPGQHAVSHLECNERSRKYLAGFKVVFAYRELRDAMVSWLRFHVATGREAQWNWIWSMYQKPRERLQVFIREAGPLFFSTCRAMLPWFSSSDVIPVRFESLLGDETGNTPTQMVRELARTLGHDNPELAAQAALSGLTAATTLTSTGSRTRREDYWSDEVEEMFQAYGGGELNAAFGYPQLPQSTASRAQASRRAACL